MKRSVSSRVGDWGWGIESCCCSSSLEDDEQQQWGWDSPRGWDENGRTASSKQRWQSLFRWDVCVSRSSRCGWLEAWKHSMLHIYCLFVTPRNSLHYLHAKDGSNNIKRKGMSVQSVRLRLVLGKRFFPSTWKKSSFPPQKNQLIFDFRGGQCNESLPRFLRHSFFVSKKSDTYFAHTKLIRSSSTGNEFYFILHRVRRDAMWTILDVL